MLKNFFLVAIVATFVVIPLQVKAQTPCNDSGFNSALEDLRDEAEQTAVLDSSGHLV